MKRLLLSIREVDPDTGREGDLETYVLEGDRRQSNDRIIRRGLETLLDESVASIDGDGRRYRAPESEMTFVVDEVRRLEDDEIDSMKREHFTLVVNENVTENACRVSY